MSAILLLQGLKASSTEAYFKIESRENCSGKGHLQKARAAHTLPKIWRSVRARALVELSSSETNVKKAKAFKEANALLSPPSRPLRGLAGLICSLLAFFEDYVPGLII